MSTSVRRRRHEAPARRKNRRGVVVVVSALFMVAIIGFTALSVDTGMIALTKNQMQSAVDAAALAAAQEIVLAVEVESEGEGDGENIDAQESARQVAVNVADENGVYVNTNVDVTFGRREYDTGTESWSITWNEGPFNVVRVEGRRDQEDLSAPDGELPLNFAWALGQPSVPITANAIAYVEARDIVSVLDFSGSMNDDSELNSIGKLTQETVEANMEDIFDALSVDVGDMTFAPQFLTTSKSSSGKVATVTFRRDEADVSCTHNIYRIKVVCTNGDYKYYNSVNATSKEVSYSGRTIDEVWVRTPYYYSDYIKVYDNYSAVKDCFGLDSVSWPYPSGSWDDFIDHCRSDNAVKDAGYRRMYGGLCLVDYLLQDKYLYSNCPDLWKTPHYPMNAVKQGMSLFVDFLGNLSFGDEVGLVSYATYAQWETNLSEPSDGASVDISSDPITLQINDVDIIQKHKQAGHYANFTAMGDGIKKAREMLDAHKRYGTRRVILVMTDGNANRYPNGWSLPGGWDWDDEADFDGDGESDFSTGDKSKQYAFYEATQAIASDYVIHTLSVGAGADHDIMAAIANAAGGTHIKVDLQGNYTLEALEAEVTDAYKKIAGKVPPPKLVVDDSN